MTPFHFFYFYSYLSTSNSPPYQIVPEKNRISAPLHQTRKDFSLVCIVSVLCFWSWKRVSEFKVFIWVLPKYQYTRGFAIRGDLKKL